MGCVFRPKDRQVWWFKYRRGGKTFYESANSVRKKDAVRQLHLREGKAAEGIPVSPKTGRLTFDEAAKAVVDDYTINKKKSLTVAERRITKHLTPFFTGRRLGDITTHDVRQFIAHRQQQGVVHHRTKQRVKEVSNAEINRELTLLKRMFSLAIRDGILFHKPHIPLLAESAPRAGFFDSEQLASIVRNLPEDLRPVVEFAAMTGWRTSEVLTLEWRQVDFEGGSVRLDAGTTKNGEGRTFPITRDLRDLLKEREAVHLTLKKAGTIVPQVFFRMVAEERGGKKKPRPIVTIGGAFKSACRKAGLPGRIPHDLRRSAVRNFVRSGIPERVAMMLSGHKTRSVFDRYDITSETDLRAAAQKLDAIRRPATTRRAAK
jgi:integrase